MKLLLELPYFTLMMVRQIKEITAHNGRVWLSRQSKAEKVLRLTKGIYMGRDYYNQHKNDSDLVGMIASIIQPHSYLSGEWVLQKYGVMTEGIFNITSVTVKHTREIVNPIGRFIYSHVASPIFDGYSEREIDKILIREASAAKALYDFLHPLYGVGDIEHSVNSENLPAGEILHNKIDHKWLRWVNFWSLAIVKNNPELLNNPAYKNAWKKEKLADGGLLVITELDLPLLW